MADIPHSRAYRIPVGDYPRTALPRRPMYRGGRVQDILMGVALGAFIELVVVISFQWFVN